MATTFTIYDHTLQLLAGPADWVANTVNVALVTSSYTPSGSHTQWSNVSGNEASGTNYTAGGSALANKTKANGKLDADDLTFSNITVTFRYAVVYIVGTVDSIVNPVLAYILFDDTPADQVISAADFPIVWNSNGVFKLAQVNA